MSPQHFYCSIRYFPNILKTHKLHYMQWGDPDNPKTLLCVHGLSRNARDFDFLCHTLQKDYRIICPDLPGRGLSPWLKNKKLYNYATYVHDLLFLLKQQHIYQTDWLGTSMGGILAMMIAAAKPQLIGKLILNDIGSLIPAKGLQRIISTVKDPPSFTGFSEAKKAFQKKMLPFGIHHKTQWDHLITHGIEPCQTGYRFSYDPAILAASPPVEHDINLEYYWEKCRMPCLIIRGEHSDILPETVAQRMTDHKPHVMLHQVPGAGHAPSLMDENQIAIIQQFLAGVSL